MPSSLDSTRTKPAGIAFAADAGVGSVGGGDAWSLMPKPTASEGTDKTAEKRIQFAGSVLTMLPRPLMVNFHCEPILYFANSFAFAGEYVWRSPRASKRT